MDRKASNRASPLIDVFIAFLRLGLTSFGGPVAHLGYFRNEFVLRRAWIDEADYADTVALCQFLPGPASSQVGFALGIKRAGLAGGLAAWLGFTLPSALLLFGFAIAAAALTGPVASAFMHGLKLVAVAVVGQALLGMARTLTPDAARLGIALAAAVVVYFAGGAGQLLAIALGVGSGWMFCRGRGAALLGRLEYPIPPRVAAAALATFALMLLVALSFASSSQRSLLSLFAAFYRSGAMIFGGGHVMLPLLQSEIVARGWVSNADFLNGYGLAQAIPGPLSAFAAYLGALSQPDSSMLGAALAAGVALVGIFLPGLLLVLGLLPFWDRLRERPAAQNAMRGANAAVVGILAMAFVNPVCVTALHGPFDFAVALVGGLLLVYWRLPSWSVVLLLTAASVAKGLAVS